MSLSSNWEKQSLRVEWNFSEEEIIARKGFGQPFYKDFGKALVEFMNPYVPFETGNLITSVQVHPAKDHASITYSAVDERGRHYARTQYYGIGPNGKQLASKAMVEAGKTQPSSWSRAKQGTTSFWDRMAWTLGKEQITKTADRLRKKYVKK